jgi:hypothetical protein
MTGGDFTDEYDDEPTVDITPLLDTFKKDVPKLAQYYIDKFFEGKEMYWGGPVPRRYLHSEHYVDMVLNTDVCEGVSLAYLLLKGEEQEVDLDKDEDIPSDVKKVVELHTECARLNIPKCFCSGITLMYLELCCGMKLPPTALATLMAS